jgi:hypothetical protein
LISQNLTGTDKNDSQINSPLQASFCCENSLFLHLHITIYGKWGIGRRKEKMKENGGGEDEESGLPSGGVRVA